MQKKLEKLPFFGIQTPLLLIGIQNIKGLHLRLATLYLEACSIIHWLPLQYLQTPKPHVTANILALDVPALTWAKPMDNFTHVRRNIKTNVCGTLRTRFWFYIALQPATPSTREGLPSVSKGNTHTHAKFTRPWAHPLHTSHKPNHTLLSLFPYLQMQLLPSLPAVVIKL